MNRQNISQKQKNGKMRFFQHYIKQRRWEIGIFLLFGGLFGISFVLYHLPVEAVFYPFLLCAVIGFLILLADFIHIYRRHLQLVQLQKQQFDTIRELPETSCIESMDYQILVQWLCKEQAQMRSDMTQRYNDMVDYYTIWAHQIKTPIAAMRLTLQNEDSVRSRQLNGELFRIEQYVEMVLMFLRLDSDSTDYVFRKQQLDPIIRQSVKKFAGEFIHRQIRLEYSPVCKEIVTDEKWLAFILEQVLSNALKYTPEGSISIFLSKPDTLCIADTGIGIAAEDLPRIFEKGYTGYNGRKDKKASGIGLYLCKRVCQNLGLEISAASEPEKGTKIFIQFLEKTESIQ